METDVKTTIRETGYEPAEQVAAQLAKDSAEFGTWTIPQLMQEIRNLRARVQKLESLNART